MGAELAGALLGFILVGFWIDRHYGTYPWAILICAILGLIGGLYNFFRSSLRSLKAEDRSGSESAGDDREDRPPEDGTGEADRES